MPRPGNSTPARLSGPVSNGQYLHVKVLWETDRAWDLYLKPEHVFSDADEMRMIEGYVVETISSGCCYFSFFEDDWEHGELT